MKIKKPTYFIVLFFLSILILFGLLFNENGTATLNILRNLNIHTMKESPEIIQSNSGNKYIYNLTITNTISEKYLELHTIGAYVNVRLNDELLYTSKVDNHLISIPRWHFIYIPKGHQCEPLVIEIHNYANTYDIAQTYFYIGSYGDLVLKTLLSAIIEYFLNAIILVLSIISLYLVIIQKSNKILKDMSIFWLSVFDFVVVGWLMMGTFFIQLLCIPDLVQYYLYYLLLYLCPIFLIFYIHNLVVKLDVIVEFYIVGLVNLVLLLCQVTNVYTFMHSIYLYFVFLLVVFMAIFVKLIKSAYFNNKFLGISFILAVMCMFANCFYYMLNRDLKAPFILMQYAIILFNITNLQKVTSRVIKNINEIQENSVYREIALKDKLTNLGNRYAFDTQIAELDIEDIAIVSLDINNLKYYNDTLGHICGDLLIKEAANLIKEIYPNTYRTGGDEFVAIVQGTEIELLATMKENLVRHTLQYNKANEHNLIIEIAIGYSKYKFGDKSYEMILKRSDDAMYKHKEYLKSRSVIKSVR